MCQNPKFKVYYCTHKKFFADRCDHGYDYVKNQKPCDKTTGVTEVMVNEKCDDCIHVEQLASLRANIDQEAVERQSVLAEWIKQQKIHDGMTERMLDFDRQQQGAEAVAGPSTPAAPRRTKEDEEKSQQEMVKANEEYKKKQEEAMKLEGIRKAQAALDNIGNFGKDKGKGKK